VNKKKVFSDILVIIIGLALFIIWYEVKFNNHTITALSMKNYKIYLVTMDKTSNYWYILNQGAADMAEMLGVTYLWEAPVERIVDEQITILREVIDAGADAILVAASDPRRVSSVIEDAKARSIKIIYVDAPANEEGIVTLATDNYSAGVTAAETMISELEAVGIRSGTIGIIGVTPENITTINRERGFRGVIEEDGRYYLLQTVYTDGNEAAMQEAAISFINNNPDLVGLFGTNEDTTEGVGNAIRASNRNITGVGFDMTDTISQMIEDGYLKAVMVQNPYTMGYLGMAEAVAALKGYDTGPPYINTGVSTRTQYTH
jgi:ribose transport system substrate-binding protein